MGAQASNKKIPFLPHGIRPRGCMEKQTKQGCIDYVFQGMNMMSKTNGLYGKQINQK